MKKLSRSKKLLGASALALAFVIGGAGVINAQVATTTTASNPMSSLVSAIATKFNLNATEVQTVVDQTMEAEHAAREVQQQQEQAARLAQAVTDGTLTQAQADLITAKSAELKATRDADRAANTSLTQEQMKAKMDAERTALTAWATANNIPSEYLRFVGGGKGMGGHGGMKGPQLESSATVPSTSNPSTSSGQATTTS